MKFNYKEVGKEIGWSFDKMKHSVEQDHPYFYYHEVVKHINANTVMLDIGCGSGEKSSKYFGYAKKVMMLDNEPEMLKKAKENVENFYKGTLIEKFEYVQGNADESLNFDNDTFDLVVSRHCGANMKEVYRILKKGGVFISEDIDNLDCIEIKKLFNRGQDYPTTVSHKQKIFLECLNAGFSQINLLTFDQREYYPNVEELKYLLCRTPIIDGYDEEKDIEVLNKYCSQFATEKGILLNRKLYAFELVK